MNAFIKILGTFLMVSSGLYLCQSPNDTMEAWISKFYHIGNIEVSQNGRWIAANKFYDQNNDTIMVFDSQNPLKPIGSIKGLSYNRSFLNPGALLSIASDTATFWNFRTNTKRHYVSTKKADVLKEINQYCILDKNGTLTVYDINGQPNHTFTRVQNVYITDGNKRLYLNRKEGNTNEIVSLQVNRISVLHSTENEVKQMVLSNSGNQLFITELNPATSLQFLTAIDTNIAKVVTLKEIMMGRDEFLRVTEIKNGKGYLFNIEKVTPPSTKTLVDIWYGNDGNLKAKKSGVGKCKYYYWQPTANALLTIPNDEHQTISSLNSQRYFLAFNPFDNYNYVTQQPQFSAYLYDIQQKTFSKFTNLKGVYYGSPEIICSPDGQFVLGSENGENWTLFELGNLNKTVITKSRLQNPVFSSDGTQIFFESDDDIWRYHIKTKKLEQLKIAGKLSTQIINYQRISLIIGYNVLLKTFDVQKPLLVKAVNVSNLETLIIKWQNGHANTIVNPTVNYLKEIQADEHVKNIFFTEENYNKPPMLYLASTNGITKKVLFEDKTLDKTSHSIKQEAIEYFNSQKKSLKGILYYPENFRNDKKYPMIVRIYQIQSNARNEYQIPGYKNPVGFDIRALLRRGYFVYMPDIIFTEIGTGLSALDCVNNALDAVLNNPNIDVNRIGLMGHSHGGYETNFIATHSSRFKAYISGAGNSDIVRSYFSYNYNFNSPFYWQFENGQYEMNIPFSEKKELYFKNNPIYDVEKVNAPILLWAGKKDENIAWDQVMEFYVGLKRNGKNVIALFYPNGGHALGNGEERKDLYNRVLEWWDYFLKDKKGIEWINKQL
ncbi:S9 family peptidase [Pedobacter sp. KLB.chiD]|uniref:S9 family peptidase n=1 Tax=Pedobacter sp. KLB.chiD TaxID=3387402 RepID=UPI00399A0DA0